MARNYKRDRLGRFARVAGGGAKKRLSPKSMSGRERLALNASVLAGPLATSAAKGVYRNSKKSAAIRETTALKRAQSTAAKEQAFWDKELGPGAVRVTAGTTKVGAIRKKVIP